MPLRLVAYLAMARQGLTEGGLPTVGTLHLPGLWAPPRIYLIDLGIVSFKAVKASTDTTFFKYYSQ